MSSGTTPTRGHCVLGAANEERDAKTEELMAAVGRLMRRG